MGKVRSVRILIVLGSLIFGLHTLPVSSDSPEGFISINCGGRAGNLEDPYTILTWVTDETYLQYIEDLDKENVTVRASVRLESTSPVDNAEQLKTAMVFYPGNPSRLPRSKFCYSLPVYFNQTEEPRNFFLRATFPSRQLQPISLEVDLSVYSTRFYFSIDSTYVATIDLYEHEEQNIELVIAALSDTVYVCLIPLEDRSSMPAISALELRPMEYLYRGVFDEQSGTNEPNSLEESYLVVISRFNFGGDPSSPSVRYPYDKYDRLWPAPRIPSNQVSEIRMVKNTTVIDTTTYSDTSFDFPAAMYSTAWEGVHLGTNISFTANLTEKRLQNPAPTFYVTVMFDGLQDKSSNTQRYIDILVNPGDGFKSFYDDLPVHNDWNWVTYRKNFFMTDVVDFIVRENGSSKAAPLVNGLDILGEFHPIITRTLSSNVEVISNLLPAVTNRNFDKSGDPCLPVPWAWIVCSRELPPRVTQINMTGKGLRGTLPLNLGELGRLTVLDLSNNSLTGRVPDSLGEITSLTVLNLKSNNLTGVLPELDPKSFRTLQFLSLANNQFTGNLSSIVGALDVALTDLSVNNNFFTGPIPLELMNLTNLRFLDLSKNNLSGQLEVHLSKLQKLETFRPDHSRSLADNQFTGGLSSLVVALDDAVTELSVSNNSFTGHIPLELMNLTNLRFLDLSRNNLSGKLEPNLSKLQKLETLRLDRNQFTGDVLDEIWYLPSLVTLNLNENNFTRLNLTTWYSSVMRADSFDGIKGPLQVQLLRNQIDDVILPSLIADINIPPNNEIRKKSLQEAFILLGGNPWCGKRKPKDKTLIERYLCRFNQADDFWPPPSKKNGTAGVSTKVLVVVGVLCGLLVLALSCVSIFFLRRMRRRTLELQKIQEALAKENVKPPFFNYEDIKTATGGFSVDSVLGAGGYGTVYKATMVGGTILAVKRLRSTEQNTSDFFAEMVNISGIKHRHLIQLKGCCVREKQRMLVYEYAENKNLAEALWGADKPFVLSWEIRFKICLGVARGLSYLHEELQPKMIHRDIKPENILLDKDYNAKIADFGLIRPTDTDFSQTFTLNIGGTRGYMPPEYMSEGMVSEKLDVFSFGIVLLETVSGRKSINHTVQPGQIFLRNWALELYEQKNLLDLVDAGLLGQYNEEEVMLVLQTAVACCQMDSKKRPTMSQVVSRFMKHEDVPIDITGELNSRMQNLEGILEEDNAMGPNASSEENGRSEESTLLHYSPVEENARSKKRVLCFLAIQRSRRTEIV
ncbi:hypothetical protein R1sor_013784 [Riccia sorocarpa]|uniref:Protein kinase domain-containing protein n=1 Tax=Riccia sorocarpa TaxID=122646 RepID=A0ABD3HAR9_9MARC